MQMLRQEQTLILLTHFLADSVGFKSIKPINVVVVSSVSHSTKSGRIDIMTYLGKIAIYPDCNFLREH